MKKIITAVFGTSPKTTIMGYLSAIGIAVYPFLEDKGFDFSQDWRNIAIAVIIAIWGRIQKDSNGITAQEGKAVIKPQALKGPSQTTAASINKKQGS